MNNSLSAWIRWPGYLAWVFLVMLVLSVLTVRSGNWQQGERREREREREKKPG